MKHQHGLRRWSVPMGCTLALSWSLAFSQSVDRNFVESVPMSETDRRGQFIAAFDWSVDRSSDYIWPFESMGPAAYKSVWMVVEKMPSGWTERGRAKGVSPLSAHRSLRVNGQSLPKPQRVSRFAGRVSSLFGEWTPPVFLFCPVRLQTRPKEQDNPHQTLSGWLIGGGRPVISLPSAAGGSSRVRGSCAVANQRSEG